MIVNIDKSGPLAVPLDDLKAYLGIGLDDEDAALADLIRTASETAERFLGRMIIARSVTQMRGAGRDWQALAMRPVRAVTDVDGLPADGASFALPPTDYALDIDAQGTGWVRLHNAGSAGRIRVTYLAGLAADADEVPDAIQHAIVRMAGELHAQREGLEGKVPASVATLLRPWRLARLS